MKALFWKDCRINSVVLLFAVIALVAPYVFASAALIYREDGAWPVAADWADYLMTAAMFALGISSVTAGMLAGNTIACERQDRSAEFLAFQPISRATILISKLLVAAAVIGSVWLVNLIVIHGVAPALSETARSLLSVDNVPRAQALMCVLLFGACWLGSALLSNPAMAVALGFGIAVSVPMTMNMLAEFTGWPTQDRMPTVMLIACLAVGGVSFTAGTIYYLRRVEP